MHTKGNDVTMATNEEDEYPHFYDDSKCVCLVHPGVQVHHAEWGCCHEPQGPPPPPSATDQQNSTASQDTATTSSSTVEGGDNDVGLGDTDLV